MVGGRPRWLSELGGKSRLRSRFKVVVAVVVAQATGAARCGG